VSCGGLAYLIPFVSGKEICLESVPKKIGEIQARESGILPTLIHSSDRGSSL
jgi:hypothetical protein